MTNKIWITRTAPAERSAVAWADAGFDPVLAPLLTVVPLGLDRALPEKAQLIFTSANGVRHSGLRCDNRPVYAVGPATANAARKIGFTRVTEGGGDWEELADLVEATEDPIVHIRGETVRGDLHGRLASHGFNITVRIVYRTEAVTGWPVDPMDMDAVALYSPKASEALMGLPRRNLAHLTAYCLSENVADPLRGLDVRIAERPNEASLIACSQRADG